MTQSASPSRAAEGGDWPHYATYPQDLEFGARDLLRDFDAHLERLGKPAPDKADVLAALKAATGKDHAGFFEFWEGWGITVDPASTVVSPPAPRRNRDRNPRRLPSGCPETREEDPAVSSPDDVDD